MIRFIVNSFIFRKILIGTIIFAAIFVIASIGFDYLWSVKSFIMLNNLNNVYSPPAGYDNLTKINLKLTEYNKVAIEANKKFKILNSSKDFGFIDTITLTFPDKTPEKLNKYYFTFESAPYVDSLYMVVSNSIEKDKYWKQIFLSSVFVEEINEINTQREFKIENKSLVNQGILENNDTLIQQVCNYFNENKNTLGLAECGTNCLIFSKICNMFFVPCRILTLQGGDALNDGFNSSIGYPLHAICEVYSSKLKKWYVIDPSYGVQYSEDDEPKNAIEISNMVYFNRMSRLKQDSILITRSSLLDRDYFKYYENIYYQTDYKKSYIKDRLRRFFYNKYDSGFYLYSNNISAIKNGYYYVGLKTVLFLIIISSHLNFAMYLVLKRLISVKKPNNNKKNDRKYILAG